MHKVYSSVAERYVNPLFEVFDGGDFVLSSYRDIEEPLAEVQIYFADPEPPATLESVFAEAEKRLSDALAVVGAASDVKRAEVPDEDWKFAYRRHFTTERIGRRIVVRPPWEPMPSDGVVITLDPGMAFGTGKHETTRACLAYVDALAPTAQPPTSDSQPAFLDMGCGSGILSIAAAKLGYAPVIGFDVDPEAVDASRGNAAENGVLSDFRKFALGRWKGGPRATEAPQGTYDVVVANILGPLLIRFADEIASYAKRDLIVSGILNELYPEVLAAYVSRGFRETDRTTIGEWTTGHLVRATPPCDASPD